MSYQNWDSIDENEDNDNIESSESVDWGGRDGVIFLIDATDSMFREDENQTSSGTSEILFRKALKCCHMTMLKKVMGSEKDLLAVVLFGTSKKENHLNLNHLCVLQSLEQPNVEKIMAIDKMIKSDSCGNFRSKYGHSDDYCLQDALWLCQSMFSNCELKMTLQRILLFTANDKPHADVQIEQQRALDRAGDLCGLNITLELLPLGSNFNVNLFYKDLVVAAMGEDYAEQALGTSAQQIEDLLMRVCRFSHKKRSQGRHLLFLGPKLAIGVGIYSMLRRRPMPKRVWLEKDTNLPVKSSTHHFDADSGEVILPMDVMKFKQYGGQKIIFNPEETKGTNVLEPGFYLLGFMPKEEVKLEQHFKMPYFIFPDENQVKGSRKTFAALLKRCAHRKKVMICWGAMRRGSQPKQFALFPQLEQLNPETGAQEIAGGFHAYTMPSSANIRPIEVEDLEDATESQCKFANEVVSKLTFTFRVHNFQNPVLQTLWTGIEALALDMPNKRDVEDTTKPKYDVIKKKLDKIDMQYDEVFSSKDLIGTAKTMKISGKRMATSDTSDRKVKQLKSEDFDVEELANQGKVGNLKVEQLKTFLMAKGLKVTGKRKGELIDMVYQEFDLKAPKNENLCLCASE